MHRHANLREVCDTYAHAASCRITPGRRVLLRRRVFFAYGLGNSAMFPLQSAQRRPRPGRPTPTVAERLQPDRPTLFFGIPTFYAALLAADLPDDAFASVRLGASAGEALPASSTAFTSGSASRSRRHRLDRGAAHLPVEPARASEPSSTGGRSGLWGGLRVEQGNADRRDEPAALFLLARRLPPATGVAPRRRVRCSRASGREPGDPYVRTDDGFYTYLGRADDMLHAGGAGCRRPRWRSGCLSTRTLAEVAVVAGRDADGHGQADRVRRPGGPGATLDPAALWSSGAARGSPRSSGRVPSSA